MSPALAQTATPETGTRAPACQGIGESHRKSSRFLTGRSRGLVVPQAGLMSFQELKEQTPNVRANRPDTAGTCR